MAIAVTTIWSFLVPDAAMFQRPELARVFFWHFPPTILLTFFMGLGCYFSLRYFMRFEGGFGEETDPGRRREWDARAVSALEIGMIFGVITMLNGIIFSKVQWGAWWQWDPRQTSFLIALLIYAAYFALRGAMSDPERRAGHSAAYMLAASLPLVFLIFVFPRLPGIDSLHPTNTIVDGLLKGQYLYVTLTLLALSSILSAWLYRQRVRAESLLMRQRYGQLEIPGSHPAPTHVVRPVPVSREN